MRFMWSFIAFSFAFCSSVRAEVFVKELLSPDKTVSVGFHCSDGKAIYKVSFRGQPMIRGEKLGFILKDRSLTEFSVQSASTTTHNEVWNPIWGQSNTISNNYSELNVALLSGKTRLNITFRAYNDGFAFRYELPKQKGVKNIQVLSEESTFSLEHISECWWSWADYNTLEKLYNHTDLDSVSHVAAPFTLKRDDGIHLSIHEAAIEDYSTMTLKKVSGSSFQVNLVPWADGTLVKSKYTMRSPWRAFLFGTNSGELLTNNLILNLNEPCNINDISWIKPMNYIGIWWEMHLGISTWKDGPKHGSRTENAKRYIDFAAANGMKGLLLEGWNTGWENWGSPEAFDFVTPSADLNLKEVVTYARSKGVEIIGHHETGGDTKSYEKHLEKAFQFYHDLGIRVVKTGYAGPVTPAGEHHHGQCMVQHYNKVMKMAAKYRIMLDVHEPIILSGLSRTYPNLMTAEGVRGMEWNAWSEGNPPSHSCTLPFTRGVAGPMDYTPGIFDIDLSMYKDQREKWNSLDNGQSAVHSTLSNQLALMIILYSPLQMAADLPENYAGHPAFTFINSMPTTWDETRILDARIGEYIVMARRSGTTWYVAAITNETGRTLVVNTDFLENTGNYVAKSCSDAKESHYEDEPETYILHSSELESGNKPAFNLAPGGGFIMKISKQ
ncbi:MAG: glycoside hydrolase family 97 protein [Flavobacteriia bacterium]|jgi:alpha-glucosidase